MPVSSNLSIKGGRSNLSSIVSTRIFSSTQAFLSRQLPEGLLFAMAKGLIILLVRFCTRNASEL